MRTLSIIIPTHNRCDELDRTLASLGELRVPTSSAVEVLVIDNNCTDDTRGVVERWHSKLPSKLVYLRETKKGASAARNLGITTSQSDHLAFFDDDVRVSADWIEHYFQSVDGLAADCVVGPVDPLLNVPVPDFINDAVLRTLSAPYSHKGDEMRVLDRGVAHELPGCNFGAKRSAVVAAGMFDENLGPKGKDWRANEDFELGGRMVAREFRTVFNPGCRVRHLIGSEKLTKEHLRRRYAESGRVLGELDVKRSSIRRRVRLTIQAAKYASVSGMARIRGQQSAAFEAELLAIKLVSRASI